MSGVGEKAESLRRGAGMCAEEIDTHASRLDGPQERCEVERTGKAPPLSIYIKSTSSSVNIIIYI